VHANIMALVDLLFSPKGRMNRAKYILVTLLYLFIGVCGSMLFYFITGSFTSTAAWIFVIVVFTPIGWSSVVIGIKRLHDRSKSGLWMLLFYLAPYFLDNAASSAERHGNSTAGIVAEAIGLAITLWALVELMCLRGTIGPNPYGADPVTRDIPSGQATGRL
jgi:uncharacterized membrane protein YhaH (DUF805 family)